MGMGHVTHGYVMSHMNASCQIQGNLSVRSNASTLRLRVTSESVMSHGNGPFRENVNASCRKSESCHV